MVIRYQHSEPRFLTGRGTYFRFRHATSAGDQNSVGPMSREDMVWNGCPNGGLRCIRGAAKRSVRFWGALDMPVESHVDCTHLMGMRKLLTFDADKGRHQARCSIGTFYEAECRNPAAMGSCER